MLEYYLAQALGMVSFALGVMCFYQKNDQYLRIVMMVFNVNHALHFALLGAVTSCLSSLISALRTGISIKFHSKYLAFFFILITVTLGYFLSDKWYDLFPIIGTSIGTYALYCFSGLKLRFAFLIGAFCWLINNIIVGSIGGILLESTLMVVNSLTIYRLYKKTK